MLQYYKLKLKINKYNIPSNSYVNNYITKSNKETYNKSKSSQYAKLIDNDNIILKNREQINETNIQDTS